MSDISEVYETSWSLHWKKLYQESLIQENALQWISIGATHTLVTSGKGKLYSWGWNDWGQCGHHPSLTIKELDFGLSAQWSLYASEE